MRYLDELYRVLLEKPTERGDFEGQVTSDWDKADDQAFDDVWAITSKRRLPDNIRDQVRKSHVWDGQKWVPWQEYSRSRPAADGGPGGIGRPSKPQMAPPTADKPTPTSGDPAVGMRAVRPMQKVGGVQPPGRPGSFHGEVWTRAKQYQKKPFSYVDRASQQWARASRSQLQKQSLVWDDKSKQWITWDAFSVKHGSEPKRAGPTVSGITKTDAPDKDGEFDGQISSGLRDIDGEPFDEVWKTRKSIPGASAYLQKSTWVWNDEKKDWKRFMDFAREKGHTLGGRPPAAGAKPTERGSRRGEVKSPDVSLDGKDFEAAWGLRRGKGPALKKSFVWDGNDWVQIHDYARSQGIKFRGRPKKGQTFAAPATHRIRGG